MMKIAACLIVKDEAHCITRCLDSLRPLIDEVHISDTGSSDETVAVIANWINDHGLAGQVYRDPWQDFATNRNLALQHAREAGCDWAIMIDADEVLEFVNSDLGPTAQREQLEAWLNPDEACCYVTSRSGTSQWNRTQLLNLRRDVRWVGAVHEYLEGGDPRPRTVSFFYNRPIQDSARNRDSEKFVKDAQALEAAHRETVVQGNKGLRARYELYTAQSWRDAARQSTDEANQQLYQQRAINWYHARFHNHHGWAQERYVAAFELGNLHAVRAHRAGDVAFDHALEWYDRAVAVCPVRFEADHAALVLCRTHGAWATGWARAVQIQARSEAQYYEAPQGTLFPEPWRQQYGLADEISICAYWVGLPHTCIAWCDQLLASPHTPQAYRDRINTNRRLSFEMLANAGQS